MRMDDWILAVVRYSREEGRRLGKSRANIAPDFALCGFSRARSLPPLRLEASAEDWNGWFESYDDQFDHITGLSRRADPSGIDAGPARALFIAQNQRQPAE
jgi:hypothetical protein